jgi:hypothetical protein
VSGTLDPVTGDALQQAVRRSLATQPEQLLIDVDQLRIGDPLGLAAFGAVLSETAEWPNVPIIVCGADPRTEAALSTDPACAGLLFAADGDEAFAAAMAEAGARPGGLARARTPEARARRLPAGPGPGGPGLLDVAAK